MICTCYRKEVTQTAYLVRDRFVQFCSLLHQRVEEAHIQTCRALEAELDRSSSSAGASVSDRQQVSQPTAGGVAAAVKIAVDAAEAEQELTTARERAVEAFRAKCNAEYPQPQQREVWYSILAWYVQITQ